ncbi:MAG: hypothetical protein FWD24_01220 [Treponema sp.]|nr:hypothetical protein [Treponema sp.]
MLKNKIIFTLLTLLTILIVSCPEPFDLFYEELVIPQGKGAFTLNLSTARTILPNAASMNINNFDKIDIIFTNTSNPANSYTLSLTTKPFLLSHSIILEPGTYKLDVKAYYTGTPNDILAAQGTYEENNGEIVISVGHNNLGNVSLRPVFFESNHMEGSFTWEVTVPSDVIENSVKIEISPISASGTPKHNASFNFTPSGSNIEIRGSADLYAGLYNVTFTFERPGGQMIIWHELLQVHANMTSHYEKDFPIADFSKMIHTVTFILNNGEPNVPLSVLHGNAVDTDYDPPPASRIPSGFTPKTADAYLYLGTPPATPGFTFAGWFKDAACTDQWFENSQIRGDMNVYAKWDGGAGFIDVSTQSGANDVEKAINYVNANATAGNYFLLLNENHTGSGNYTIANANLTLQGIGSLRNFGNQIVVIGGTITLGNNINTTALINLSPTANIILDGSNASFSSIVLSTDLSVYSSINITNTWNGNSAANGIIILQGTTGTLNQTIDFWNETDILTGTVNDPIIFKFTLNYFISGVDTQQITGNTAPTKNYKINLVGGAGRLQEVTNNNTVSVTRLFGDTTWHVDLEAALNSITLHPLPYTVTITTNQTLAPYTLPTGTEIILSAATPVTIQLLEPGSLFTVNSGIALSLENNVTLQGINNNNAALVHVNGGNFIMNSGSVITGNTSSGLLGGGVYVQSGSFSLNGGTIRENSATSGGGVSVAGIFTMTDGTISRNTASTGGGVYVLGNGTFTKDGGVIYGSDGGTDANTATMITQEIAQGHAAYHMSSPRKMRTLTSDSTHEMRSITPGIPGGWDGILQISGNPVMGQTLTADYSILGWTPTSYEWIRTSSALILSIANTYIPVSSDVGMNITLIATGTVNGVTVKAVTSIIILQNPGLTFNLPANISVTPVDVVIDSNLVLYRSRGSTGENEAQILVDNHGAYSSITWIFGLDQELSTSHTLNLLVTGDIVASRPYDIIGRQIITIELITHEGEFITREISFEVDY